MPGQRSIFGPMTPSNASQWEPISRAHGERFGAIGPTNTLIRADLVGDGYLVEMEAEALLE